jgi:hypothetical protein
MSDIATCGGYLQSELYRLAMDTFCVLPIEPNQVELVGGSAIDYALTAYKAGYAIDTRCINQPVADFIIDLDINYNATFYKSWKDLIEKTDIELLYDQILHYLTTYGTNYSDEVDTYVPNDNPLKLDTTNLKVIKAVTMEEFCNILYDYACSGIACSDKMIWLLKQFIKLGYEKGYLHGSVDAITNKEVATEVSMFNHVLPVSTVEKFRTFVYAVTGKTLLIKDKDTINAMAFPSICMDTPMDFVNNFPEYSYAKMVNDFAEIFYRFKPLFLSYRKSGSDARKFVNLVRRKAKTLHKPMVAGFFESLTTEETYKKYDKNTINHILNKETNAFKLCRAYNILNTKCVEHETLKEGSDMQNTYIIRNGKVFEKSSTYKRLTKERYDWMADVRDMIFNRIVNIVSDNRIKNNKTAIILPSKVRLACPISNKMMFGNIPYGSYFEMTEDNFFGVYWRHEWGTDDFDLSYISASCKFGWNGSYRYTKKEEDEYSLLFSGDMTYADPEAVEMFYAKKNVPNGLIKLNRYNGTVGSRAEIFYGNEIINNFHENYMVNPDSVAVRVPIISTKKEQIVGLIYNNKIYFVDLSASDKRVSDYSSEQIEAYVNKLTGYLMLDYVLIHAGYDIVTDFDEEHTEENTVDLRKIEGNVLIDLFK